VSDHNLTIAAPDESILLAAAKRHCQGIRELVIDSADMYQVASQEYSALGSAIKKIDEERMDLTRPLDELKKTIMGKYTPARNEFELERTALGLKLTNYANNQKRIAAEAQAKADEEARVQAKLLRDQAEKLAQKGKSEQAEAKLEQAAIVQATPRPVAPALPSGGPVLKKTWRYTLTGLAEFLTWLAGHEEYYSWVELADDKINAHARSTEGRAKIPGLRFDLVDMKPAAARR
jgi:hypothetical protein